MIILTPDHRYVDDATGCEYPGVTATIRDAGLMGWVPQDEWYADRGKAVHAATALWDQGTLDTETVDPRIRGYLDAWIKYRSDTGFEPQFCEEIYFHKTHQYCGTLDRDGIDLKTGVPCAWHIVQAASYWRLYADGPEVARPWQTVYLRDDATYTVKVYNAAELYAAFRVFTAALLTNEWKRRNGL